MIDDYILSVKSLAVVYQKNIVLDDLTFEVPRHTITGIIGPNGAGKSTFLKAAMGFVKPLAGSILFDGLSVSKYRKKIAYVPQRSAIDWDFPINVFEVVKMGLYPKMKFFSFCRPSDKKAIWEALDQVGMTAYAQRHISELSSGQQQRVFIARALLQNADIYLLDEPFTGVDMATEKDIMGILKNLKQAGKTIFIVHHDLNCVTDYFDWLVVLNKKLIGSGSVSDVFTDDILKKAYGRSIFYLNHPNSIK
ncbi:MAG: metal ABC transporter ATP-binding protein [Rhabdochlamydiaceae bacterium]